MTLSTKIGQHRIDAQFVNGAKAGVTDTQANPAVFTFNPEPAVLQVGKKRRLVLLLA